MPKLRIGGTYAALSFTYKLTELPILKRSAITKIESTFKVKT